MAVPSFFIVGAPRCGTSSLYLYLSVHPRVFVCRPKEPHHFGSDLGIRWRPFADRDRYLALFEAARPDQRAGEASVQYLYSTTAPREIREMSPDARIIILLRDPVEMVCSLHAHNLLLTYEDLTDLTDALAAEEERRAGSRIPANCIAPLSLQYARLAQYVDHVRRYREAFGPDRVKCILFEDLQRQPERVYAETLAFLGLEPAGTPQFKAHNQRQRWRNQSLAAFLMGPYRRAQRWALALSSATLRTAALLGLGLLFYAPFRLNLAAGQPARLPAAARAELRRRFQASTERLAEVLGRDLSAWLPNPSAGGQANVGDQANWDSA